MAKFLMNVDPDRVRTVAQTGDAGEEFATSNHFLFFRKCDKLAKNSPWIWRTIETKVFFVLVPCNPQEKKMRSNRTGSEILKG